MTDPEQDVVEQKIRRATAINALHKIGAIVAEDRQAEAREKRLWRWTWILGALLLSIGAMLLADFFGFV